MLHDALTFASEAEILAFWGAAFVVMAGLAFWFDRRSGKRPDITRVGMIPWIAVGIALLVIGGGLISVSLPVVLGS